MARKKLNQAIESLVEGKSVTGTLGEVTALLNFEGEPMVSKFGQPLEVFDITDEKGEIRRFWMNGGLKGAFKMSKVKPGMKLEIVHTGKKLLEEWSNEIDTYDIYSID